MKTLESLAFRPLLRAAVAGGLAGAAIVDVDGKPLAIAGAVDDCEIPAMAAVVARCMHSHDLLMRMLDGALIEAAFDDRVVGIGIASRCVFVIVIPGPLVHASHVASENLRSEVERLISRARADFSGVRPQHSRSGGSSSGPAQLPVVEWGITARKPSGKSRG